MRKMVIFFIVCFGLGTWGLIDAASVYPNRGRFYSQFMLQEYLQAAETNGVLAISRRVNVEDPAQAVLDLEGRQQELNAVEEARFRWLNSLRPVYGKSLERLTAENQAMQDRPEDERTDTVTVFADPAALYTELDAELQGKTKPKPLSQTDIAVQWLICFAGYAGALLVMFRIIQTRSTVYRYEPSDHRLILSGGKSITPDQIEVVDKSKWHKFFVTLELKDGTSHKFDLLRFEPLEDWILEMEEVDPRLRAARDEAAAEEQTSTAEVAGESGGDGGGD
jgi:hypothetical protein